MTYTPSPHHEHEERERVEGERRAREERRERGGTTVEESLACLQTWKEAMSEVSYHEDFSRVSRSMLSTLKESPRLYYELYVARSRRSSPPTAAMTRGTRFELLLMDPIGYRERYAIAPQCGPAGEPWDRRKTEHKRAWAEWSEGNAGKEHVTTEEHNELLAMVAGALRHPEIDRVATAEGQLQHRLDWNDPVTGTPCKSLMDKSFVENDLIVDIKTAEDPSPEAFSRSVARYGYHRQEAWYRLGYRIHFDETPRFLFCVVGSKPPYDAAVYELDDAAMEAGQSENEHLLSRLVELTASGEWLPSWGKGVVTLSLPRWHNAFASEVYE